MNEAPSNQTGGAGETFSSQPSQTNPFTADLKGEFTSNFGTNTNAVSQIFKEGGFAGGNNRQKYLIIGAVVVVVLAVVFIFFPPFGDDEMPEVSDETPPAGAVADNEQASDDDKGDDETTDEATDGTAETPTTDEQAPPAKAEAAAPVAAPEQAVAKVPASVARGHSGGAVGHGPIALTEPADGSSVNYDETQGPAVFSWTGGGGHIVFSRNQSMHPPAMRVRVTGHSYAFNHPWPGTWYWKVENASGSTEVRSFTVSAPARRNVQLTQPTAGGTIAGNGGTVTWQGDAKVAYYRIELSTGSWAAPAFKFASSGNSVALSGVTPGAYQMRVGAFSEVSGRWEFSQPVQVTVQ